MKKVVVIGIDGADPEILYDLANQGVLPNFQGLMAQSSYGILKSTIPPHTASAWTSSTTGVNIGKHGIHSFILSFDTKTKRIKLANSKAVKAQPIWDMLSNMGKRVIVLNVPLTYPPKKVNGVLVSGILTPSLKSDFTYPREIRSELLDKGYEIDVARTELDKMLSYASAPIAYLSKIEHLIKKRVEIACYLMREFEWDFFMVVFVALDRIHHCYWKFLDHRHADYDPHKAEVIYPHIMRCYLELDKGINQIYKLAGKEADLIMYSDHGFKPINKFFFVNGLLFKMGFLKLDESDYRILPTQKFLFDLIKRLRIRPIGDKLPPKLIGKARSLLNPSGEFIDIFQLDFNRTRAYYLADHFISINMEKVEGHAEREKVRDSLVNMINENPLCRIGSIKAVKKEELYSGPQLHGVPDIVLTSNEDVDTSNLIPRSGEIIQEYKENLSVPQLSWRDGAHDQNGIIILKSPAVGHGLLVDDANIVDIAPTILRLMDLPIPKMMDGKPLGIK